jgi:uncharacterized protein
MGVQINDQRFDIDEQTEASLPDVSKLDAGSWKNPLKGWYNRPEKKLVQKDTKLIMKIPTRTECWRKTRHNFCRDNSPFHWQKTNTQSFTAIVNVSGAFENTYDKAGLMIRVDEANWCTAGLEWFEGTPHAATCVTIDSTDWSLVPLPKQAEKAGVWFAIQRNNEYIDMYYSFDGTTNWVPLRQARLTSEKSVYVGIFGSNPLGKTEFRATYDFFNVIEH